MIIDILLSQIYIHITKIERCIWFLRSLKSQQRWDSNNYCFREASSYSFWPLTCLPYCHQCRPINSTFKLNLHPEDHREHLTLSVFILDLSSFAEQSQSAPIYAPIVATPVFLWGPCDPLSTDLLYCIFVRTF